MTKRFKLGYVCGDFGLIDNDEWIDLCSMSENSRKNAQICINKMNELAEENEQLKSKHYWYKQYKELLNENEQLKQQLFETSKELLWATSDEVDRALHYEDEVEELRKEIFE